MSNTDKKIIKIVEFQPNLEFNVKTIKSQVLSLLLRNRSIFNDENEIVSSLSYNDYEKLSKEVLIPIAIVKDIIEEFLLEIKLFVKFLKDCKIRRNSLRVYQNLRIYLHKIHRIAPVFDFKRARTNSKNLQILLENKNYYPQLFTQIALVLYITDKKCSNKIKLQQKNIRIITNCSAYAFHRIRNKLDIDKILRKNIKH